MFALPALTGTQTVVVPLLTDLTQLLTDSLCWQVHHASPWHESVASATASAGAERWQRVLDTTAMRTAGKVACGYLRKHRSSRRSCRKLLLEHCRAFCSWLYGKSGICSGCSAGCIGVPECFLDEP